MRHRQRHQERKGGSRWRDVILFVDRKDEIKRGLMRCVYRREREQRRRDSRTPAKFKFPGYFLSFFFFSVLLFYSMLKKILLKQQPSLPHTPLPPSSPSIITIPFSLPHHPTPITYLPHPAIPFQHPLRD